MGGLPTCTVDHVGVPRQHGVMNPHEHGFLEFLAEPNRRRISALLEKGEKRRTEVRSLLDHATMLDPRFCKRLTGSDALPSPVEAKLRALGAPNMCHVIAAAKGLDGRDMPLREALDAIIGSGNGAFVSCLPGRLGYYEYEEAERSYLLSR